MNRSLIGTVALALLAGLLLGALIGWRVTANSRDAQQLQQAQVGRAEYGQAVDQGASAVAAVQARDAQINASSFTLDQEIRDARNPLVVAPAAVALRCPAGDGARPAGAGGLAVAAAAPPQSVASVPVAAPSDGAAQQDPAPTNAALAGQDVDGDGGLQLSLGAVRLWNSALIGEPRAAALAADTCPADDPAAPACAAGAGITLREAWRNHNANAALCAKDRGQLAELIGLLRQRQAQTEHESTAR